MDGDKDDNDDAQGGADKDAHEVDLSGDDHVEMEQVEVDVASPMSSVSPHAEELNLN